MTATRNAGEEETTIDSIRKCYSTRSRATRKKSTIHGQSIASCACVEGENCPRPLPEKQHQGAHDGAKCIRGKNFASCIVCHCCRRRCSISCMVVFGFRTRKTRSREEFNQNYEHFTSIIALHRSRNNHRRMPKTPTAFVPLLMTIASLLLMYGTTSRTRGWGHRYHTTSNTQSKGIVETKGRIL